MYSGNVPTESPDPIKWIKGLAESATRVRLAPGVVGKTTFGFLGLCALWGIIFWRLGTDPWLNVPLFAGGCIATLVFLQWSKQTRKFAEDNPALALMEGADITEYKKFEAQSKGQVQIEATPVIPDPAGSSPQIPKPKKEPR